MERVKIAVVGSLVVDLTVLTPRLPRRGENLLAERLQVGPGGKGANAAVAARRLGADVLLVGCVGDDAFGRQEIDALQQEGVDLQGVRMTPHAQTGAAVILVEETGENTILVAVGANDHLTRDDVEGALGPHRDVLRAVLVDFEVPAACVRAAVEFSRANRIPVLVDTGPARPYGPEAWSGATILSPNREEAAGLAGYPIDTDADVRRAARDLLGRGPEAVVLRLGSEGAFLCAAQTEALVPGFRVRAVDTTGAGDAFMGALTVAVAEGMPLREAVRFANAAGAVATTRVGTLPVMPFRTEVTALLAASS